MILWCCYVLLLILKCSSWCWYQSYTYSFNSCSSDITHLLVPFSSVYSHFLCFLCLFIVAPSITHRAFLSLCVPCRAGLIAHLYAHPSHNPSAVGPLELANALAACCLSSLLSSQHRQWGAQQLVRTLAAHDRDNNQSRPQTFADMAGDLRKCSFIKLEAHQSRVGSLVFLCIIQWGCLHHFCLVVEIILLLLLQVITCGWCSKKGLLATSGNDGTVRVWNVTKSQYTLQQTCVFNKE